ncbi:MAG: butyrate kinase [Eubacterium sp.]|jgi:butyrate kinase|nr:butyrate kinase [Eubacterium sp.]
MKEFTILTINPGSSSTKCGLVKGEQVLLDQTVDHDRSEFADCKTFADQEPIRIQLIRDALKKADVDLSQVDAVVGRGVGLYACAGGTYEIDNLVYDHATRDVAGIHHPATLGIKIAYQFGKELEVPAYFVNPMPVDELCDVARMTGIKDCYRPARSHPLNQKQVAIHHSEIVGKKYEESSYIILHLGGGISVTAHKKGRAVDGNRAGDAQGPISPNRSGDICVDDIATLMKRGVTFDEIYEYASNKGGLVDLVGTDDLRKVKEMIASGDKFAKLSYDAMVYTIIKWTAMMGGALYGDVDAILMTGGMANDKEFIDQISEGVKWIAPVYVYPGSFETEAMASGAIRVLSGREEVKKYTGKPVWDGFDF